MRAADAVSTLLPTLLSGTGRKAPPLAETSGGTFTDEDPKAALKALALAGQALRFVRPEPPTAFDAAAILPSDRLFLEGEPRKLLARFAKDAEGELAAPALTAIARAMDASGFAPHPFDLEALGSFVDANAEWLGSAAHAWARRSSGTTGAEDYYDWSALDDATWTKASLGQRERFLRTRRGVDPAAARALLEAAWPGCSAEERFRLARCLSVGLSEGDRPFLEGLVKDRAPRVRDAAAIMLIRASPDGASKAVADIAGRIKSTEAGFIKKRVECSLEFPATVKEPERAAWIVERFGRACLSPIARTLGRDPSELAEGAALDGWLSLALVIAAANERRDDCLERLSRARPDAWEVLAGAGWGGPEALDGKAFARFAELVVRPGEWTEKTEWAAVRAFGALSGWEPIPDATFAVALGSEWARAATTGTGYRASMGALALALLCPSGRRASLSAIMKGSEETRQARDLLDLLAKIEERGGTR